MPSNTLAGQLDSFVHMVTFLAAYVGTPASIKMPLLEYYRSFFLFLLDLAI
jgi:hypothetical protein